MSEHTNNIKEHCVYIKDRAQKITEALYRVTDLFPEQEPLKWLLRKEGVNILNNVIVLESDSPHARVKGLETASQMIPRILCVLELASSGTLISNLNFEVLRREYSSLHDFIKSKREQLIPQPTGLLSAPTKLSGTAPKNIAEKIDNNKLSHENPVDTANDKGHVHHGQYKGHSYGQLNQKNLNVHKNQQIEKTALPAKKIETAKDVGDSIKKQVTINPVKDRHVKDITGTVDTVITTMRRRVSNGIDSEVKLNRQKRILSFIKDNDWVRVGDIASIFENSISEKTVQRDLVAMVDFGILRKAGDKRWRRYALM